MSSREPRPTGTDNGAAATVAGLVVAAGFWKGRAGVLAALSDAAKSWTGAVEQFQFDAEDNSLFNHNCHQYLAQLLATMPEGVLQTLSQSKELAAVILDIKRAPEFSSKIAYGNVYKSLFEQLESEIVALAKGADCGRFIDALFPKSAFLLQNYQAAFADVLNNTELNRSEREKRLKARVADLDAQGNNDDYPACIGGAMRRFINLGASNYKPQYTTGLGCLRHYAHSDFLPSLEYRIGTQAQRDGGLERLNPFFSAWLDQQLTACAENKIGYVYINNLGLDRDDFAGKKERALTRALHQAENDRPSLAMITLPADQGLLDHVHLTKAKDERYSFDETKAFFVGLVMGKQKYHGIGDVYISPRVKEKLYPDNSEQAVLERLLEQSIARLGLAEKEQITAAQRHGLFFDFIKFELTNYILTTLQPAAFNISCKDGIDRAGVHSAYYNLIKSIALGQAMSRAEFMAALQVPPIMVKGRPMNHHIDNIRNALRMYTASNHEALCDTAPWLNAWCCDHVEIAMSQASSLCSP